MSPEAEVFVKRTLLFVIAFIASTTVAQAATIFVVTLTGSGFAFGGSGVLVTSWSQTSTFTNVVITSPLLDNTPGGPIALTEGAVYLVNQFGPGTTSANNVAVPTLISGLTSSFTTRTLFSGLTLGPGTYYLVWVPGTHSPDLSMSPEGGPNSIATGPGVSFVGIGNSVAVDPFPPATNTPVSNTGEGSFIVSVTGDLVGVPAMNETTLLLMAALLVVLIVATLNRRPQLQH